MRLDEDRQLDLVLSDDDPIRIDGLDCSDLTASEYDNLQRLTEVIPVPGQRSILLRRNRQHRIGRVRLRDYVITVPPPMPGDVFVDLFLYASGADLSAFTERGTAASDLKRPLRSETFVQLLAYLMVSATERLLTRHIAKSYESRSERLKFIRGRPSWSSNFGRHPVEGLTCSFSEQATGTLLNRLVLSGLRAAALALRETEWALHANNQIFIWRTITEETFPSIDDYAVADRRISRMTEHYRPVLHLSRALTCGFTADPFSGAQTQFQLLEFSLPLLYEKFLFRLLSGYASRKDIGIQFKEMDPGALVDGLGDTYRFVEPDIVMTVADRAVAVIDAKYKIRYLEGVANLPVQYSNRATNADIYQLFFYQARLQSKTGTMKPPEAVIVVPLLDDSQTISSQTRRTIMWQQYGQTATNLKILALPLRKVIGILRSGGDEAAALQGSNEIYAEVSRWHQA